MNPETAETQLPVPEGARGSSGPGWLTESWRALRADPERMTAVRETWQAFWSSRLLVWVAGVLAVLVLGNEVVHNAFDPPGVATGHGWLGDLLAAPAARWDGLWYLWIAHHGYQPGLGLASAQRAAFFPLYPLALALVSQLGLPAIAAGVLVSLCAFALGLYGIHRLATLELGGPGVARTAVMVTAFAPMALFFSAIYSESLYLALSVGVFWGARKGRWALVGVLGALAGATRSAGVVLIIPALLLYLYGPRDDRRADRTGDRSWWTPRYRVEPKILWLGLMPLGLAAYMAYMGLDGRSALAPFHVQEYWDRHFAGPFAGVWTGLVAAFEGARQLLSGQTAHVYLTEVGGNLQIAAGHDLLLLLFLAAAVPMIVGVLRRLPLAYGAYVLAALALPLSYPVTAEPLMSLPRFLVVLFPLSLWLGSYLAPRPRLRRAWLAASAVLLVFFTGQFSTWHWVA